MTIINYYCHSLHSGKQKFTRFTTLNLPKTMHIRYVWAYICIIYIHINTKRTRSNIHRMLHITKGWRRGKHMYTTSIENNENRESRERESMEKRLEKQNATIFVCKTWIAQQRHAECMKYMYVVLRTSIFVLCHHAPPTE